MAEWLTTHGHEVRVVTAPPYYPDWQITPGYRASRHHRAPAGREGLALSRVGASGPKGLNRLFHLASFSS